MADDLPIKITLDPTAAAQGAKKVTDEVAKAEDAAKKTTTAFDALTQTFKRIADFERAMAAETARSRAAIDNLSGSFRGLGAAISGQTLANTAKQFDSLTQAIKREQEVLRSIHGPAQDFQRDLQIINKLQREGKITAEEHARALMKAQQAAGIATPGAANGLGDTGKIAAGVASLNFKQAASGANQAFELLNQKLKITETALGSAVGSAVKFGATGAQIAGPWGAAVGAVVGITADLVSKLTDAEAETRKMREEQEKLATEYWATVKAAEAKKKIEQELAPEMEKHSRLAKEIAEREAAVSSAMNSQGDAFRKASDRLMAYEDELKKVNEQLALKIILDREDPTRTTPLTDEESKTVMLARQVRDAMVEKNAATKSYGQTLSELEGAENKRNDRLRDLEQIMGDINVSEAVRNRAFKEYDELSKKKVVAIDAETKALRALIAEEAKLRNSPRTIQGQNDVTSGMKIGPVKDPLVDAAMRGSLPGSNFDAFGAEDEARKLAKAREEAAKFQATVDKLAQDSLASLNAMAISVGDSLVDAFTSGEFSASKFFSSLGSMAAKSLVNNLINFGFANIGGGATGFDYLANSSARQLPGFATGGDIYTRGAGSTDSMLAAFRITPGESIHVRTPEQRRAASQGGSRTVVIENSDGSRTRHTIEDDFEELVIRTIERNTPAIRGRLTGR